MAIEKALYTAQATSTGGRTGTTKSSDGRIELQLSTPKALGGDDGPGTNPEQLFASGYSACFIGAMKAVAARQKVSLPANVSIKSDVSIGPLAGKPGAFGIAVAMAINVPGMDKAGRRGAGEGGTRGVPVFERDARQRRRVADGRLIARTAR